MTYSLLGVGVLSLFGAAYYLAREWDDELEKMRIVGRSDDRAAIGDLEEGGWKSVWGRARLRGSDLLDVSLLWGLVWFERGEERKGEDKGADDVLVVGMTVHEQTGLGSTPPCATSGTILPSLHARRRPRQPPRPFLLGREFPLPLFLLPSY